MSSFRLFVNCDLGAQGDIIDVDYDDGIRLSCHGVGELLSPPPDAIGGSVMRKPTPKERRQLRGQTDES